MFEDLRGFLSKQTRNFQLVLLKKIGFSFFNMLTRDYVNIYIRLLWTNFVQLGLMGSIGGLVNAIIAYPFGSLIDRYSSKKILLLTIAAQDLVPLTYFYARDWMWVAVATELSTLAMFCSRGVENVVVANSLKNEDRATGFSMVTALSLIPTVFAPLEAGAILTRLGGLIAGNIRGLFLLELTGVVLIGLYVGLRLEEIESLGKRGQSILQELGAVMVGGPYLKRWLLIDTMSASSFAVMVRFVMVYAVEEKGSTP